MYVSRNEEYVFIFLLIYVSLHGQTETENMDHKHYLTQKKCQVPSTIGCHSTEI